ncbi:hypothetical protein C9374_000507 [Naegleria lovaniensis]|uniref:Guanylate cyclase domain-containing protein n=1 Tax=Naegleria lovaniensis TaxID=51637 RepID=A0AA88KNA4_NAELO|nr:uncharacterized protein C9374_000507 [Naegleria lovaniensis]KAG2388343.1 hypothetical protein C9374_000507 [Naegleria lovaniensis]
MTRNQVHPSQKHPPHSSTNNEQEGDRKDLSSPLLTANLMENTFDSNRKTHWFLSIRFCLILLVSCLTILSVLALSITWGACFIPTITQLSNSYRDHQLERIIDVVDETLSDIAKTSEEIKQQIIGDGLTLAPNTTEIHRKIWSCVKSTSKTHEGVVIACFFGDSSLNVVGAGRLNKFAQAAAYTVSSLNTHIHYCPPPEQNDYCLINESNPGRIMPPLNFKYAQEQCNKYPGEVVYVPSRVEAHLVDVTKMSLVNCVPLSNGTSVDSKGNRFAYFFGHDLTSASVAIQLKSLVQPLSGYRGFIVETQTGYLIAVDNNATLSQLQGTKIFRATSETVNDTDINSISKTAMTNLGMSFTELPCNTHLLTSDTTRYISLYRLCTVTRVDWVIVLSAPQWNFISSTVIAIVTAIWGSLVIISVGIMVGVLFSVRIAKSIYQLIELFESVAHMDLECLSVQKSNFSEIYLLQKQFVYMIHRMKLYKSFIPSHLLAELEQQGDSTTKVEDETSMVSSGTSRNSLESSKGVSLSHHGISSSKKKYLSKDNKFQLYLEKRRVTLVQVMLEGLNEWVHSISPNEMVLLLSDVYDQLNSICRVSGASQISSLENDSLIIAFNATRDQQKHEEKAALFCHVLNEKLVGLKYMKWKNEKSQQLNVHYADLMNFRFALITQECLCGNVGSQEMKQFSVLSSGKYNLAILMDVAKHLNVNMVCSENVKNGCSKAFNLRYLETQNFVDDMYINSFGSVSSAACSIPQHQVHIYEIGAKLHVENDEWMYELSEKEKKNQWNEYNKATHLFLDRRYQEALDLFQTFYHSNTNDKPTENLIQKCQSFM